MIIVNISLSCLSKYHPLRRTPAPCTRRRQKVLKTNRVIRRKAPQITEKMTHSRLYPVLADFFDNKHVLPGESIVFRINQKTFEFENLWIAHIPFQRLQWRRSLTRLWNTPAYAEKRRKPLLPFASSDGKSPEHWYRETLVGYIFFPKMRTPPGGSVAAKKYRGGIITENYTTIPASLKLDL